MSDITEMNELYDPKCPGCNKVHPRKKCLGFWVVINDKSREGSDIKDCKDCFYKGPITIEDFFKGMKRSS